MEEQTNAQPTETEEETKQLEAKYTQDDFNKGMANKAHEIEAKYKGKKVLDPDEFQKAIDEAMNKGAERAKMSAEEKAKADEADRQKAIEAERQSAAAEMSEMKARMSLYETKDALTNAGLPADFAEFLNDVDVDKRNANIGAFKDQFTSAVDAAVAEKLKGKQAPQTGNTQSAPKVTKTQPPVFDATKMSVTDFMATDNQ